MTGLGSIWVSWFGPTPWWVGLGRSKVKYRPVQPIKKPVNPHSRYILHVVYLYVYMYM
jgi:hypothetical protein